MLVALPTGLGKTFIAAVVILNMFRWYPHGKIIFVAPTRPLVTQQQQACHSICGLPWDTAIELTGSTKRSLRDDEWHAKRIFYMTPQTFENDLLSTTCDPKDVICVVVDEAHRATGNYAYCKVIRHLMYHNPHFRVLALTATPGNSPDRVQEVVTNLHISRIEIRTEEALDIQPYLHKKKEDLVRVSLSEAHAPVRLAWSALMAKVSEPLQKHGLLQANDPSNLRAFAIRASAAAPHGQSLMRQHPYLRGSVHKLATMAQNMQYLTEQSVRVFCDRVMESYGPDAKGAKKDKVLNANNPAYNDLVQGISRLRADPELLVHPKMRKLTQVLKSHFLHDHTHKTRAMVFCTFREVVHEIVDLLKSTGLSATPFIGQASDGKGNRGLTQRQQEQVIREFQDGRFQVLVATSIGEEGLDIGEVDLIVCYDAVRDSVRGLQRIGRTGRMRDGRVVVLMSAGREENNWMQSKESYKNVQRLVRTANTIELYTDVTRLVPSHIKPEPVMCEVAQPPFDPKMLRSKKPKELKRPKPKKQRGQPIPEGESGHFCTASILPRRDEHRESYSDGHDSEAPLVYQLPSTPASMGHSSSRSSILMRSSSLNGMANFSDDSDDADISQSHLCIPLGNATQSARFAPHPLIAELNNDTYEDEADSDKPLFFLSPHRPTRLPSPSLRVPEASPIRQTPPRKRSRRMQKNSFVCGEAERETDSEEHGESDENDEGPGSSDENDEDRAAVGDFVPTQESGYEQQAVYLRSMLSQEAPTPFKRRDRLADLLQKHHAARPSSEANESIGNYTQDSFVVDDDVVSWASSQSDEF